MITRRGKEPVVLAIQKHLYLHGGLAALDIGPASRLLMPLLAYCDDIRADPTGEVEFTMTLSRMAELCAANRNTVAGWRATLREKGLLRYDEQPGQKTAATYILRVPVEVVVTEKQATESSYTWEPAVTENRATDAPSDDEKQATGDEKQATGDENRATNDEKQATSKENARASLSDPIHTLPDPDRVDRARGIGRRDLPNPYPLDIPDAVRDRSARLVAWAAGPPLHIANGAKAPKWLDACAEFERLDIPDDDIKGFVTRRTAETHREAAGRGETAEPIHSLAYHAVALTQWAQTYDPATTAPVSGKPKRDRGFLSDADTDAEQIAGALAWRQRNAKNADTGPPKSG